MKVKDLVSFKRILFKQNAPIVRASENTKQMGYLYLYQGSSIARGKTC